MKRLGMLIVIILLTATATACSSNSSNESQVVEAEKDVEVVTDMEETTENVEETEGEIMVSEEPLTESEKLDAPVETNPKETSYEPAFEGQTRVNGVRTVSEYSTSEIATGLDSPWGIAELPGGSFAITEKGGTMRLLSATGELSGKITGFPEVNSGGQGGLLDVEAAPDFSESRRLYFTFSDFSDEGTLTAVGVGRLSDDNTVIEEFETIYRALPYYKSEGHYGSRIAIDEDGNLFVSTGDRMDSANRMSVQDTDTGHGKVVHITPEGEPVSGGPFSNEVYSYGHRNVQGLDIHPETGELWASEMGPRGGDELNLILEGKNYGWPLVSYGVEYSGSKIGDGITQLEDTEQPVYYWDPVLAPSGMTFYDSDVISEWTNNLFIGGLRSQHIARIIIEDNKVVGEERLLEGLGERFRDLEVSESGHLYAITDGGSVYKIGK